MPEAKQICSQCKKVAPSTKTNYTLIGSKHGWRLTREKKADGSYEAEWYCPECWRDTKKK